MAQSSSRQYPITPTQPHLRTYNLGDTVASLSTMPDVGNAGNVTLTSSLEVPTPQENFDQTTETPPFARRTAADFWAMVDRWERRQSSINDGGQK
jgi:hypothetical protein